MALMAVAIACLLLQDKPGVQAARPQRTEAEARARADENRRKRAEGRRKTGAPVELIADFTTHKIEMDVFHAKRIRPVTCG